MEKVLGIGGVFFRSTEPDALAQWYADHLGIDPVPADYDTPCWQQAAGSTVFAPFRQDTGYFRDPDKQFMLNFRVRDLEAMAAQLEAAGIPVEIDPDTHPNGRFGFLKDPEGNPVELWEEKDNRPA